MSSMKKRQRGIGFVVAAGALAACSVDTSDVHFVPDEVLSATGGTDSGVGTGNAGAGDDIGGSGGSGGQVNVGGGQNKAGTSGKAGASTGGAGAVAGAPPSAGGGGVPGGGGGGVPSGGGGGVPSGGSPGRCAMRIGNPTELLIDDLDDGDPKLPMFGGREGGWYVSNDGSGTQTPPANMPPQPDKPGAPPRVGAAASPAAMHTSGSGFTEWGANMGLTLYLPPGPAACPYDVSPHRGVRFWIKSAIRDATVRFVLPTVETHAPAQGGICSKSCGDHFGIDISPVPTVWTQLEIPFTELRQQGFGTAVKFYPSHALNVEWALAPAEDFDFWIDQVEFY